MRLGVVLAHETPPEVIPRLAALAEDVGFDEVWISEDGFSTGVGAAAALALDRTANIGVGFGVASAMVRHPAILALEIATIARNFPGRFAAGIGLGVIPWLDQMGLSTRQQLAGVRECVTSVSDLLAGQTVNRSGGVFILTDVALAYPPQDAVPVHMGATGPRMLELSGEIADGTVLSVASSEQYIRWAQAHIDKGQQSNPNVHQHHLTVFAIYSVEHNRSVARHLARAALAAHLYHDGPNSLTGVYGIEPALREMRHLDFDAFKAALPEDWVDDLTISGEPEECAARITRLMSEGVDTVALLPADSFRSIDTLTLTGTEVFPLL